MKLQFCLGRREMLCLARDAQTNILVKNGQNLQFWIPKNFEECVLFVKKTLTNVLNAMKLDDLKQMFFLNISKKARKTIHLLHKEQDKSSLFGQRQIGTTSKSVF